MSRDVWPWVLAYLTLPFVALALLDTPHRVRRSLTARRDRRWLRATAREAERELTWTQLWGGDQP